MSTSTIFAGNSRFAADFSQVIERAIGIASLPIQQYQQQKAVLDTQTAALTSVKTKVDSLAKAIKDLTSAFGSASYQASNTNNTASTATLGSAPTIGSWTVNIKDLGSPTSFVVSELPPVLNPAESVYTAEATQSIIVDLDPLDGLNDAITIDLAPAGQTLQNVVDEINNKAGAYVQAAIVNVGTSASPQYQLSLQSRALGPVDITYKAGATEAKNAVERRGAPAEYNVNGLDVTTDSRSVLLAPGVTLSLDETTTSAFTITTTQNTDALSLALDKFVAAYNGVEAELDKHRGTNAPLAGNSVLNTAQAALRKLVSSLSPTGSFTGLSDLGIGYNETKDLYLDKTIFGNVTQGKFEELKAFFGGEESGFIEAAGELMDSLTESETGSITSLISTTEEASASTQKRIDTTQDLVDRMELSLMTRMAEADAAIAMLEQQVLYFAGMWEAMREGAKAAS
jgi:flagellar hook-associated protein 2